jgi:hypothetical protein
MMTTTIGRVERHPDTISDLIRRVQSEYSEMPGLCVTLPQAKRLLAIDETTCAAVFAVLVKKGTLRRTPQGRYVRA